MPSGAPFLLRRHPQSDVVEMATVSPMTSGVATKPEEAVRIMKAMLLRPTVPFPGANKDWPSECEVEGCGEASAPRFNHVRRKMERGLPPGCRYCVKGEIGPRRADRMAREAGAEPLDPFTVVDDPRRCQCLGCGELVFPTHREIANGKPPCPNCDARHVGLEAFQPFLAVNKLLSVGLFPLDDSPLRCRHIDCGELVDVPLSDLENELWFCPYCIKNPNGLILVPKVTIVPGIRWNKGARTWTAKTVIRGQHVHHGTFKTLAEAERIVEDYRRLHNAKPRRWLSEELMSQLDPSQPLLLAVPIPAYSTQTLLWICPIHGSYENIPARRSDGKGCRDCAGNILTNERMDTILASMHLERASERRKSQEEAHWHCLLCDLVFPKTWNDIQQGHGCPDCGAGRSGSHKRCRPSKVYLVQFRNSVKVGITCDPLMRLRNHIKQLALPFFPFEFGPFPEWVAKMVEQALVAEWRESGYESDVTIKDGWTETAVGANIEEAAEALRRIVQERVPKFEPSRMDVRLVHSKSDRRLIREFVTDRHYLRSVPNGAPHFVGLYRDGELVGAAIFGRQTYNHASRALFDGSSENNVVELQRFVVSDDIGYGGETWFLSRSMKALRGSALAVLAYSDPGTGHFGGCYQAANFLYLGTTGSSYHYETSEGRYVHKRTPWDAGKRRGKTEGEVAVEQGLSRIYEPPKYRYAYPLTKAVRRLMQDKALPYPKPDRDRDPRTRSLTPQAA